LVEVTMWMDCESCVVLRGMGVVDGGAGGRSRRVFWRRDLGSEGAGVRVDCPMQLKRFSQSIFLRSRMERWQKRQVSSKTTRCWVAVTGG
jgi:hypothetical protein